MRPVLLAGLLALTATPAFAGHELDNRDIGNGRALYMEHCASCHGARLEGQPNWRSAGPDGVLPAPPTTQADTLGITTTGFSSTTRNWAARP